MSSQKDVYIMIDIKLEGARKIVTVHSALIIQNMLSSPVEVMALLYSKPHSMCILPTKETFYVPVHLLHSTLFVRPVRPNGTSDYCRDAIDWRQGVSADETCYARTCRIDSTANPFFKYVYFFQTSKKRKMF